MRATGLIFLMAVALAGCSSSSGSGTDASAEGATGDTAQRALCADPAWKDAHLGLWYNICRGQNP